MGTALSGTDDIVRRAAGGQGPDQSFVSQLGDDVVPFFVLIT